MQNLEFRLREGSAFRNEPSTYKKSPHLLHMWSSLAFNQEGLNQISLECDSKGEDDREDALGC